MLVCLTYIKPWTPCTSGRSFPTPRGGRLARMNAREIGCTRQVPAKTTAHVAREHVARPGRRRHVSRGGPGHDAHRVCVGMPRVRQELVCRAAEAAADEVEVDRAPNTVTVEEEVLPQSRIRLKVTAPADQAKRAWQRALRKVAKDLSIPGFRKGKQIPESVLYQHVGKEDVVREAIELLLSAYLPEVGKNYSERAYSESLTLSEQDELVQRFDPEQPFVFSCEFDVVPKMVWKGDYKKLKVTVADVGNEDTDRERSETRLRAAVKEKGRLSIVSGRGLQKGDVALVDFQARRAQSGEPIAGSKRDGMQIDTGDARNSIGIPGIADGLVGMTTGEARTITENVPDTWWEVDLRGSEIVCDVKLKELFEWNLPELDDDLAKQLLPSCSGVEELRGKLLEAERTVRTADVTDLVNRALTFAVADIVDVEVPEAMIRELALTEYQAQLLELQSRGEIDPKMMDDLATEEMLSKFIETRREEMTRMQAGVLGFEEIFTQEGMSVNPEEVEAETKSTLAEAAEAGEELDRERLEAQVFQVLKASKVLQFLVDNADIDIKPYAPPVST